MKLYPPEAALHRLWGELPSSGRVILAVSGGVDSMALLEAAQQVASKNFQKQRVLVAHVNHGLRGQESDADEAFVRSACVRLGLDCCVERLTWEKDGFPSKVSGRPSQASCRRRREAFFDSLLASSSDRILYAHHRDDQAETVLFRLIRGTGARGLRGMRPASAQKLRPFLGLGKRDLFEYAQSRGLVWREDSSNQSLAYDRNWIRLELLPMIETRRPGFAERLASLAAEAQGWRLPKGGLELFPYTEEACFARVKEGVSTSELSAVFKLGRKHAVSLQELLRKPSGRLEAEGVRFTWSAGLLLAERGSGFADHGSFSGACFSSCLGEWFLDRTLSLTKRSGEKIKKEFQKNRVPLFFRDSIPLVSQRGKAKALLPLEAVCRPSPLAQWWLRPTKSRESLNPSAPIAFQESDRPLR